MEFETKVKLRMFFSVLIILAGGYLLYFANTSLALTAKEYFIGFYTGTGLGLIGAGSATFIKNLIYQLNPNKLKKAKIEESDERNLYLWIQAGHRTLIITIALLFISLIFVGVSEPIVFNTILNTLAAISFVYLINYIILKKTH